MAIRSKDWGQLGFNDGFNPALEATFTGVQYQITTTSGLAELALARHLQKIGVNKYSPYWCLHCQEQKELFPQQAFAMINYIEYDSQGHHSLSRLCKTVGITSYPTWEIQGELRPGRLSCLVASRSVGLYWTARFSELTQLGSRKTEKLVESVICFL